LDGSSGSYVGGDNACHNLAVTVWKGFVSRIGAYTLTAADSGKYVLCTGGSWTLTLPAPVLGLYFQVKNDQGISGTTGTITITPTSGTIDGLASIPLLPGQECTILTDGTNFRSFGRQRVVVIGTLDVSGVANASVLLPVGYRYFEIDLTNVVAVSSCNLQGLISINGGSTWGAAVYDSMQIQNSSATALGATAFGNQAQWYLTPIQTTTPYGAQAKLTLWPGNGSVCPTIIAQGESWASGNFVFNTNMVGMYGANNIVNAFQINCGGVNFSANITVKGVV